MRQPPTVRQSSTPQHPIVDALAKVEAKETDLAALLREIILSLSTRDEAGSRVSGATAILRLWPRLSDEDISDLLALAQHKAARRHGPTSGDSR